MKSGGKSIKFEGNSVSNNSMTYINFYYFANNIVQIYNCPLSMTTILYIN